MHEQLERWPAADVAALAELLGRYNRAMEAATQHPRVPE